LNDEVEIAIDLHCQMKDSIVIVDPVLGAFDAYMVKTDIKKGEYSGNTFYKMQLLYEYNREVYFLYTRWGRVGDTGQQQMTAFSNKDGALKEYLSVFKAKSGNAWENKANFEKKPKKYKLVPFDSIKEDSLLEKDFYEGKTNADYV
jgi:predicted DNA-binding WGR domain protein